MQSGYRFIPLYEMLPTMIAYTLKEVTWKESFMKLPFSSSGSREICLRLVMALATHNATGWPAVYINLSYLANIIASRGLPSYSGLHSYFLRRAEYSSSILQSLWVCLLRIGDTWPYLQVRFSTQYIKAHRPYTDPVPSRISGYSLILTPYHQVPTIHWCPIQTQYTASSRNAELSPLDKNYHRSFV